MDNTHPLYEKALNVMRSSLLFKNVNEEFLKETLGWFELVHLKKGTIIHSDETLKWMYMPIEGRVKASQINSLTGKEYIVFLLSAGDIFDIIALMENEEHEMILEAIDDVSLLRVGANETRAWLDDHPEFNKNFLPYLGKRMRYLAENASDLALHDTTTRLSKLILRNIDTNTSKNNSYKVSLINDLSHDNIAKMIGSVRAVVNRSIQILKSDKVIESSRKEKRVKNLKGLINRCEMVLFDNKD
ncbi:MAG: cAMP receptor protein [uncultured Sulfurovum sp.]|uniref:cAMP receptor protein n=1 Tax=uncultured Sulfurovum sp. TaxID=269237 RepID=A0A6S6TR37_9BACT|nr:MAG: cAMP receptor protein [uncultured Sulfurovum sp.]